MTKLVIHIRREDAADRDALVRQLLSIPGGELRIATSPSLRRTFHPDGIHVVGPIKLRGPAHTLTWSGEGADRTRDMMLSIWPNLETELV